MKTSTILALFASASSTAAFAPTQSGASTSAISATKAEILAEPNTIEFGKVWDPCGLAELGGDETLSWFRHSEVKHGRVAMAAFVGWWATGAGLRFPGELSYGQAFSSIPSKGIEAWEAVPGWGKAQLLLFAGLIEFHDELFYSTRGTHYMKGGTPGKNMVPGLFDPFNLSKNKSAAKLTQGRSSEIKNGRLAMIGIAGMWAAASIPGSVPLQPDC